MAQISMKDLLEAGVHFGHQTRRWNPKMKPYIYGDRNGIYIIDLHKTRRKLQESCDFVRGLSYRQGTVLFVGTKKQAQESTKEAAQHCSMYYVNQRWLGGMLTNFQTIRARIEYLQQLNGMEQDGTLDVLPKKESARLREEKTKLERVLGGIRSMTKLPDTVFISDLKREHIAVAEARKLEIPIVAIADTNCDPDDADYVIPGNDDAIRALKLVSFQIAEAVLEGRQQYEAEQQAAAEGEEVAAERAPEGLAAGEPQAAAKEEGELSAEQEIAAAEAPAAAEHFVPPQEWVTPPDIAGEVEGLEDEEEVYREVRE